MMVTLSGRAMDVRAVQLAKARPLMVVRLAGSVTEARVVPAEVTSVGDRAFNFEGYTHHTQPSGLGHHRHLELLSMAESRRTTA